jgi:hypothetical protein
LSCGIAHRLAGCFSIVVAQCASEMPALFNGWLDLRLFPNMTVAQRVSEEGGSLLHVNEHAGPELPAARSGSRPTFACVISSPTSSRCWSAVTACAATGSSTANLAVSDHGHVNETENGIEPIRGATSCASRMVAFELNVAEASLTIPGIGVVIDAGLGHEGFRGPAESVTRSARVAPSSSRARVDPS